MHTERWKERWAYHQKLLDLLCQLIWEHQQPTLPGKESTEFKGTAHGEPQYSWHQKQKKKRKTEKRPSDGQDNFPFSLISHQYVNVLGLVYIKLTYFSLLFLALRFWSWTVVCLHFIAAGFLTSKLQYFLFTHFF